MAWVRDVLCGVLSGLAQLGWWAVWNPFMNKPRCLVSGFIPVHKSHDVCGSSL